ncbi:MAG: hypothetical protein JNK67_15235 [Alphaproteobacteria bacterium]|nr:hypothetical protein [Alphaproteobacteria bacterium]
MQFLLVARDDTDPEALGRRLAARPRHFEGITGLVARGELISGGALLDDAGRMIGSYCVVEFADRAGLDAWLAREPYAQGDVWKSIEITPIRIAVRDGAIVGTAAPARQPA